MKYAAAIC